MWVKINQNKRWIILGLVGVLSVLFFLKIVDYYVDKDGLYLADQAINQMVGQIRSPVLNQLMKAITLTANYQIIGWGLFLGVVLLGAANKWRYAWAMLISVCVGILFTELTKMFIGRPRPPIENALMVENGMSFPSGHSYFAIVFYGLITYFWIKHFKDKKIKIIILILGSGLCFLIGLSRIYLGVHWTTDVFAGFMSSLAWLLVTILYLEYKNRYLERGSNRFSKKMIWIGFWLFTWLWLSGLGWLFWVEK